MYRPNVLNYVHGPHNCACGPLAPHAAFVARASLHATMQRVTLCREARGRQHLFVFPSGRGATLFASWQQWISDATFLTPEAHFSDNQAALAPYSSAHRDIIIPGHMDAARIASLLAASLPMSKRTVLAAYKGSSQGKPWRMQARHRLN